MSYPYAGNASLSTIRLLTAIKTCEWFRYEGSDTPDYASTGTTGDDAFDLRVLIDYNGFTTGTASQPIQYRRIDEDDWHDTGFTAIPRHDVSREYESDDDGYLFVPYALESLKLGDL